MGKFTVVPDEDSESWRDYRVHVRETLKRQNDWLLQLAEQNHQLEIKVAVIKTQVGMYAAIAAAIATLAGNLIAKALGAAH
jgi:citrate synthase